MRKNRFSSLWVWTGVVFALYNTLIKGSVSFEDIIIQCFLIVIYFLSRICEVLESKK